MSSPGRASNFTATLALVLAVLTLPVSLVGFIGAVGIFPAGVATVIGFVGWRIAAHRGGTGRGRAIAAMAVGLLAGVLAVLQLAIAPAINDPGESPVRDVTLGEGRRELVSEVNAIAREVARGFVHHRGKMRRERCKTDGAPRWSLNYHVTISLRKHSDATLLARRMETALEKRGHDIGDRRGHHVGTLGQPIDYGIDADLEKQEAYVAGSLVCARP